jgi:hypothetical protein
MSRIGWEGPMPRLRAPDRNDPFCGYAVLERRSIYFPIKVGQPSLARQVLAVAADLAVGDVPAAERRVATLGATPAHIDVLTVIPAGEDRVAPHLRAQALARILLDLANNSWSVAVEDGQVFLRAPAWDTAVRGMSVEDLQREKDRARQSLLRRVQEQLERPPTRTFIAEQERLHFGAVGSQSIASLFADGPTLAQHLRQDGAACIRPYLQVADTAAGRDVHTGLKLWDIFRYFRYYWSFPYESTPGRTLPVLIRDAGQPSHPVCGLICLSSPIPKLSVRDSALGWTAAWLEAIVAALDMDHADTLRDHFTQLDTALRTSGEDGARLDPARVFHDLGRLLGIQPSHDPITTSRRLEHLGSRTLKLRISQARKRLIADLVRDLTDAIRGISTAGLGITHDAALDDPSRALEALAPLAHEARTGWLASRDLRTITVQRPRRASAEDLGSDDALEELSHEPLFLKKRAVQLVQLLTNWVDLKGLVGGTPSTLRQHVWGTATPWGRDTITRLTNGGRARRGVRSALLHRQTRVVASQVADVSVCGAVPPYGPLLGGKLAALLALSRELATAYYTRYVDQISEIGSQMAGTRVRKPADLVALTTTSFYSVGSAQYNRVRLDVPFEHVGWEYVGQSRGHGTIHFSRETSTLLQALLRAETGRDLITSTFGEGPSERLRKLRDGLEQLGLPADSILVHGMSRRAYIAELGDASRRAGEPGTGRRWRHIAPPVADLATYWQLRWLGPRLARTPELVEELRSFDRLKVLLSTRLRTAAHRPLAFPARGRD